jgi:hypothetical protein
MIGRGQCGDSAVMLANVSGVLSILAPRSASAE